MSKRYAVAVKCLGINGLETDKPCLLFLRLLNGGRTTKYSASAPFVATAIAVGRFPERRPSGQSFPAILQDGFDPGQSYPPKVSDPARERTVKCDETKRCPIASGLAGHGRIGLAIDVGA